MCLFDNYDQVHCNFSGGKDSIALVLLLLYGYKVPKEKLVLVHMRVDGPEENKAFFDWEETDDYLKYCSEKLGMPLIMLASDISLKERIEMRGMWPSSAMQFCTSYMKRDTYSKWARTLGPGKYLCVRGERADESSRRAKKKVFEIYKHANASTKKRYVDWLRPVHHLLETEVWELMRLAGIDPHPCYEYVSRCSCKFCIFLSPTEMAKVAELHPFDFNELVEMEKRMGHTMRYKKSTLFR
ncbi:hypothetical protein GCM10009865_03960 [Aeromicrobium ponti]|uniref:Phosphoadenosine phosphosulfate reductase family protein n=1 Tax=Cytobacillus oceanisediminis TaxID=665099 RepID=A0A562K6L9_9BACI|nr:phosphoadenosine phosphosulfate reductase family protein [Cytobacillus oceanisediminis]TWH90855.1 phosphoadenosine phosphosulfate reductase family protein [Cytobacillus oceanisediminis]